MAEHYLDCNGHDVWYLYTRGWTRRAGNRPRTHKRLAALLSFFVEGPISIGAAVVALIWPEVTAFIMVLLIAGWAVFTGILAIVAAIRLRHEINNERLLALGGMGCTVLGVLPFIQPVVTS